MAGRQDLSSLHGTISPDPDASYSRFLEWDLSSLVPQIARPHRVDDVVPITELEGTRMHQGVLGTCTNGRLEDLGVAARILKGRRIFPGFRLIIVPASKEVLVEAIRIGILEDLGGVRRYDYSSGMRSLSWGESGSPQRRRKRHFQFKPEFQRKDGEQQILHLSGFPRLCGRRRRGGEGRGSEEILGVKHGL